MIPDFIRLTDTEGKDLLINLNHIVAIDEDSKAIIIFGDEVWQDLDKESFDYLINVLEGENDGQERI